MDNQDKLATLGTQDTRRRQTKQYMKLGPIIWLLHFSVWSICNFFFLQWPQWP